MGLDCCLQYSYNIHHEKQLPSETNGALSSHCYTELFDAVSKKRLKTCLTDASNVCAEVLETTRLSNSQENLYFIQALASCIRS